MLNLKQIYHTVKLAIYCKFIQVTNTKRISHEWSYCLQKTEHFGVEDLIVLHNAYGHFITAFRCNLSADEHLNNVIFINVFRFFLLFFTLPLEGGEPAQKVVSLIIGRLLSISINCSGCDFGKKGKSSKSRRH